MYILINPTALCENASSQSKCRRKVNVNESPNCKSLEAVTQRYSMKKMFGTLLKKDFGTGVSREFCEISSNTFLTEHLRSMLLNRYFKLAEAATGGVP